MKTACITGVNGQDGSYLAELLLGKGYKVYGVIRDIPDGSPQLARVAGILGRIELIRSDYKDPRPLLERVQPDEIYHLAARSRVDESFDNETATLEFNVVSVGRMLHAVRETVPAARFYFAGSSEMFGAAAESPQNENTSFRPLSPYAVSKVSGFHLTAMYREAYGLHASSGILFNHESPRRPETFVIRKITLAAARIKSGAQKELRLGNLDVRRDWGFAGDHVEAMWLMLQQEKPDDYVIGTGESHSIREALDVAFGTVGLKWQDYVVSDQSLFRPLEAAALVADPSKARRVLGWNSKTSFEELIRTMVESDLNNNG